MIPSVIRLRLLAASLLVLGGLTPPAWALQVIPVRDGETAFARIAANDLTRIALSDGISRKIRSVGMPGGKPWNGNFLGQAKG